MFIFLKKYIYIKTTYKWEFSKTTIDINESIDINISKKTQDAENFLGLLVNQFV